MNVSLQVKTRDEMDLIRTCFQSKYKVIPEVSVRTIDGLFSKEYRAHIVYREPIISLHSSGSTEYVFTMPGKIVAVNDTSRRLGLRMAQKFQGENRVFIAGYEEANAPDQETLLKRIKELCPVADECTEINEQKNQFLSIELEVVSKKYKLDIQAVIALLGILVGSGVLIQFIQHLISIRNTKRTPPLKKRTKPQAP